MTRTTAGRQAGKVGQHPVVECHRSAHWHSDQHEQQAHTGSRPQESPSGRAAHASTRCSTGSLPMRTIKR